MLELGSLAAGLVAGWLVASAGQRNLGAWVILLLGLSVFWAEVALYGGVLGALTFVLGVGGAAGLNRWCRRRLALGAGK